MFKIILGAALGAAAFLGWQYWNSPIGDLTSGEARAVAVALADGHGGRKAELREPVLKRPDSVGWFICGWVRIGGVDAPLGHQPFVGLMNKGGDFTVASIGTTLGEVNAVKGVCAARGLYL